MEVSEKLQALYTGDLPQLAQDFEIPEPDVCQGVHVCFFKAGKVRKEQGRHSSGETEQGGDG